MSSYKSWENSWTKIILLRHGPLIYINLIVWFQGNKLLGDFLIRNFIKFGNTCYWNMIAALITSVFSHLSLSSFPSNWILSLGCFRLSLSTLFDIVNPFVYVSVDVSVWMYMCVCVCVWMCVSLSVYVCSSNLTLDTC